MNETTKFYFIDSDQLEESEERFSTVFGCIFWLAIALIAVVSASVLIAGYFLLKGWR